jgi:hypothetical protein
MASSSADWVFGGVRLISSQQVRRALEAAEVQVQRLREAAGHQRLAQSRHVLQQHVATRQHGRERQPQRPPPADEHRADRVQHGRALGRDVRDARRVG